MNKENDEVDLTLIVNELDKLALKRNAETTEYRYYAYKVSVTTQVYSRETQTFVSSGNSRAIERIHGYNVV